MGSSESLFGAKLRMVAFVTQSLKLQHLLCSAKWYIFMLKHVKDTIRKDELESTDAISWAAYHASLQPEPEFMPSITALLPLFTEESKSVAMMRHSLDIVKRAVEHLNPSQKPVVTFDQPLFALAKQLARQLWGGAFCYYAWWFAYRNGRVEMLRTLA